MLTLHESGRHRTCAGVSRRELLKVGALGLGGLTLADLFRARAHAADSGRILKDRAVVLLFLQGGPAHIELFDPKMTAPAEIRSTTGEVATSLPGVTYGGTFPQLARLAKQTTIVRSYGTGNGDHKYVGTVTAGNPLEASAGALYARAAGANHPVSGLPTNVLVTGETVQPGLELERNFETEALPGLTTAGSLGATFAAFNPSGGGESKRNMELRMPRVRLDDRRSLLGSLDRIRRDADAAGLLDSVDEYQQQAFDVITRGAAQAFDLAREDPRTIARYDTSHIFPAERLQAYFDMRRATNLLGKQMLLARRLVEAGCGFVTVADAGWDMHGNNNSLPKLSGIVPLGLQVDHAVSAFLEDVRERGLSEKVLLVVTGEMGRTPRINNRGGRDHYGELTSLLFAGGGLKMGQVIGESDAQAARPVTTPYGPKALLATILHTLFDIGELRLAHDLPTDLIRTATEHEPIRELV
ncbi:MAG: DUF1501 domain-containing protein [Planctomycetales bacterium]